MSDGLREVEERGGSVQMSGVSGTCRSDLRDSKSSAIASGSLGSRDVPLEYSLTAGNTEQFQAKLMSAAGVID